MYVIVSYLRSQGLSVNPEKLCGLAYLKIKMVQSPFYMLLLDIHESHSSRMRIRHGNLRIPILPEIKNIRLIDDFIFTKDA